jgi:beta-lactamase superfamily II metal-dependent hydrolase
MRHSIFVLVGLNAMLVACSTLQPGASVEAPSPAGAIPLSVLQGSPQTYVVTVPSIGAGQCVVISCPNGNKVVNDCGSSSSQATWGSGVALAKAIVGTTGNAYLITSHKDKDHSTLAPDVLANHLPVNLLYGGNFADYPKTFQKWITDNHIDASTPLQPDKVAPNPKVSCGIPGVPQSGLYVMSVNAGTTPNDKSLVTKLVAGPFGVITMGDAEQKTEKAIIATYGVGSAFLEATMLNAAHHGSDNKTNSEEWADQVNPQMVTFSADANSGYGHPRCSAVNNYKKVYVPVTSHAFTCFLSKGHAQPQQTTHAVYNTADSGAIGVVYTISTGYWRPFRCAGNNPNACVYDTASMSAAPPTPLEE